MAHINRKKGHLSLLPVVALLIALTAPWNAAADTFYPAGCDFKVTFPGQAKVYTNKNKYFSWEKADYADNVSFLTAECLPSSFDQSGMEAAMTAHAEAVRGYGHYLSQKHSGVAEGRFYRDVGGIKAVVIQKAYKGQTSTLLVMAMCESSKYPNKVTEDFFKSVAGRIVPF